MKTGLRISIYTMIAVLTILLIACAAVTGDEILMDAAPSADVLPAAQYHAAVRGCLSYGP